MDDIKKLLTDINEKDIQNKKYEQERLQLQEDVRQRENRVQEKIKILKRHLDCKIKYGEKLQHDILKLEQKKAKLDSAEEFLDKVFLFYTK